MKRPHIDRASRIAKRLGKELWIAGGKFWLEGKNQHSEPPSYPVWHMPIWCRMQEAILGKKKKGGKGCKRGE